MSFDEILACVWCDGGLRYVAGRGWTHLGGGVYVQRCPKWPLVCGHVLSASAISSVTSSTATASSSTWQSVGAEQCAISIRRPH